MYHFVLTFLLFFGFCVGVENSDSCVEQKYAAQEERMRDAALTSAIDDDPFGEPDPDDATMLPPAPQEVIIMAKESSYQRLLKRFACAAMSVYLACCDRAAYVLRKLKSK